MLVNHGERAGEGKGSMHHSVKATSVHKTQFPALLSHSLVTWCLLRGYTLRLPQSSLLGIEKARKYLKQKVIFRAQNRLDHPDTALQPSFAQESS